MPGPGPGRQDQNKATPGRQDATPGPKQGQGQGIGRQDQKDARTQKKEALVRPLL